MTSIRRTLFTIAAIASLAGCDACEDAPPTGSPPPGPGVPGVVEKTVYESGAHTGQVVGTVRLTGALPAQEQFKGGVDDVCVAAFAPDPVFNPKFVVNADGTLPHAFVYAHEGPHETFTGFPVPDAAEIVQTGGMYHPYVSGILLGQGLWVVNGDNTTHNVHAEPKRNKPFNLAQPPGTRDAISLTKRERVDFVCDTHSWMQAHCYVVEHPFFATTDAAGAFSVEGLPAGDYVFRVDHPHFGRTEVRATVTQGASVTLEPSLAAE